MMMKKELSYFVNLNEFPIHDSDNSKYKKIVQEATNIKINFGDLTSLLFLQGYTESEFCW